MRDEAAGSGDAEANDEHVMIDTQAKHARFRNGEREPRATATISDRENPSRDPLQLEHVIVRIASDRSDRDGMRRTSPRQLRNAVATNGTVVYGAAIQTAR